MKICLLKKLLGWILISIPIVLFFGFLSLFFGFFAFKILFSVVLATLCIYLGLELIANN